MKMSAELTQWLLDPADPGQRYLALAALASLKTSPAELEAARLAAYASGPIATVLSRQKPEGYWEQPGPGYGPKFTGTVWALLLLAQLGAHVSQDIRVQKAADYYLANALFTDQFLTRTAARGTIDCLQGNMLYALLRLGVEPERLAGAMDFLACTITGTGFAPYGSRGQARAYNGYKIGPGFLCRASYGLPCGWAAAKALLALSAWPVDQRSYEITAAIEATTAFFLNTDLLDAPWSKTPEGKQDPRWKALAFPLYYATDLLQIAEGLTALGHARHTKVQQLLDFIESKRQPEGYFLQEYAYGSRTFPGLGSKGKPSKWVTLRVLQVLQSAGRL